MTNIKEKINEFKDYLKQIEYLQSTIEILSWDSMVCMPKQGIEYRSEILRYLSEEFYRLSTSDKVKGYMNFFENVENIDDVTRAMLRNVKKNYERTKKIPKDDYRDFTMHPFTINFGNKDVRITTNYSENDIRSALFSCIHEGGHGIYEQNIDDNLKGTLLAAGASMGIHESQSRFYENLIGKPQEFWRYFYKEAKARFY